MLNSVLMNLPVLFALIALSGSAFASDVSLDLKLSLGGAWQSRNDVQIPNNNEATRYSLRDITGSGPLPAVRLEGIWNVNDKHALRLLLAPLSYSERGRISDTVRFAGATYDPGQNIKGEYRFNSWRAGYRYHLRARDTWDLWIGGTLKVRDAEIKLSQGPINRSDDNVGIVPLLYLAGEYRFQGTWSFSADLDGLAGGPGRAIDLGVSLNYAPARQWRLGVEYRVLEGGADTDEVYNFAWFNSLLLSAQYRL